MNNRCDTIKLVSGITSGGKNIENNIRLHSFTATMIDKERSVPNRRLLSITRSKNKECAFPHMSTIVVL